MKHLVGFLIVVGLLLMGFLTLKEKTEERQAAIPVLRVFAASSFIAQWGPGPWLKARFESTCRCRVEFLDGADTTILLQRLRTESRLGADLVLSVDQFDLDFLKQDFDWRNLQGMKKGNFVSEVSNFVSDEFFIPYNYGVVAFMLRADEWKVLPRGLADLLKVDFKGAIALGDPRTSSPGLQFLVWVLSTMGEDEGWRFIRNLAPQIKSYSASWSSAYALFDRGQAKTTISYTTSPLFHRLEEKKMGVIATEFEEGHPLQVEFVGIPGNCRQCELAERFIELMLSAEGQKTIMNKNYMFPVLDGVKNGTPFQEIPPFRLASINIPTPAERERILRKWNEIRRLQ